MSRTVILSCVEFRSVNVVARAIKQTVTEWGFGLLAAALCFFLIWDSNRVYLTLGFVVAF